MYIHEIVQPASLSNLQASASSSSGRLTPVSSCCFFFPSCQSRTGFTQWLLSVWICPCWVFCVSPPVCSILVFASGFFHLMQCLQSSLLLWHMLLPHFSNGRNPHAWMCCTAHCLLLTNTRCLCQPCAWCFNACLIPWEIYLVVELQAHEPSLLALQRTPKLFALVVWLLYFLPATHASFSTPVTVLVACFLIVILMDMKIL